MPTDSAHTGAAAGSTAVDEVYVLPTSPAQARMWLLDRLVGESAAYSMPFAARLCGALDPCALDLALAAVVRRHEILRTTFGAIDGEPVQVVHPSGSVGWPLVDLAALPREAREREAQRIARAKASRRFDLARGPLLNTVLLRLEPYAHLALCTLHHIVSDGWSLGVLLREIAAGYAAAREGGSAPLPELSLQYADYAVWQRGWLQSQDCARQTEYWKAQLAGAPVLDLPTDRARPAAPCFRGAVQTFRLSGSLLGAARELGARHGATPMMTLLTVFKVLLARYAGQADVVVGTPVAGRNRPELEELIGLFVNTLALRTDLGGDPPFAEALGRVRETVIGAQANQDLPFERVVETLRCEANPGRNPLFEVMFTYVGAAREVVRLPELTLTAEGAWNGTTRFDLELHLMEAGDGLEGALVYRTELYDGERVERLAGHFARLLEAALAAPESRIGELAILDDAERRQLVEEWNRTAAEQPAERCVHRLFEEQAERSPGAEAVICGEQRLSYAELNQRANRLARHLVRRGVGPEVRVGLCLDRGVEMVVSILGVLKAGGAYVPLDPAYPAERLSYLLADSGPAVLVTQERLRGLVGVQPGLEVLSVDGTWAEIAREAVDNPQGGADPQNLAYVIYTSGSTGLPKGVGVTHHSFANLLQGAREELGIGPGDVAPVLASYAFDIWGFEALAPLLGGGTVRILHRDAVVDVARLVKELRGATVVHAVPALMRQVCATVLASAEEPLAGIRRVFVGGDAVPPDLLGEMRPAFPEAQVHVLYGPTETTVLATSHPLRADERVEGHLLGRPLPNVQAYVLDGWGEPAPVGVPGELHVGGAGVARGYLGRAQLTAERFVPDALGGEAGARLYRTGDRVRRLAGGTLEFLGRVDEQVKIRGFRVEPGEIEAALRRHAGVRECIVVPGDDAAGEKRLVAYVVGEANADELRAHLRERLPEHMLPSAVVVLEELPLNPNGKVDRRALPVPEHGSARERFVAPRTPTEEMLAGIWAETLRLERVGAADDFFALGGHSLLATRVASRIREAFGVELPLRALFEGPTVTELAERVEMLRRAEQPMLPPVARAERTGALPLSFPQERLWFLDRAEDTGAGYTIAFGVRIEGEGLYAGILERAFSMVVERHEVLRTVFPTADGEARQLLLDPGPFTLLRVDLRHLSEDERDAEVSRLGARLAERPYDLERGPLLRSILVQTGPAGHALLVDLHHIVFDGWSVGLLVRELTTCYQALRAGRAPALPELSVQYADYAAWQRSWMRGEVAAGQLGYWKRQLAGLPALDLLAGRGRPGTAGYRGSALPVQMGPELSEKVRAVARERQCTLFMVLLAAFKVVLAHHGRTRDLAVGTDLAGRVRVELEALVGFFINEVVLRTDLSGDPSLAEVLGRVRGVALDAYRNQDVPFALLVKELGGDRGLGATPLFQVMFGLDNTPFEAAQVDGLQLTPFDTSSGASPWELSLYMRETPQGIEGTFRYRTALFAPAMVEDLRSDFLAVLDALCQDPGLRVEALLDRLSERERARWEDRARTVDDAARLRLKSVRRQAIPV